MILKKIACSAFFLMLFICANAQDNSSQLLIKRTTVAIFKAQKEMIAKNSSDANGKLAMAVLLQSNAIAAYKANNISLAACYSALARIYTEDIFQLIDNKKDDYFLISADEQLLLSNCLKDSELLLQAKSNYPAYSDKDKDYMDHSVLKNYNIELN